MRQEQVPQALARLAIVGLFIAMWALLWLLRIPMPLPFLLALLSEGVFFLAYMRLIPSLQSMRAIALAHYTMLGAEIVFHTVMVYFLGGASWLGAFAYVFGLIFTNAFLDLKSGFVYTAGAAGAFVALVLLDANGIIPHYVYLEQATADYTPRFLATTVLGGTGVFFSIYLWVNWVGHQLRVERNAAVRTQDELMVARAQLEDRVRERTAELLTANAALGESQQLLRATIESTADGILVVDGVGRPVLNNERLVEMWRLDGEVLVGRDGDELLQLVMDQLAEPEAFAADVRDIYETGRDDRRTLIFKDGRAFERYSRPLMKHDEAVGRVWSFRDVTANKKAEEVLRRQARHDALTATLNHASITEALRAAAVEADRHATCVAVVMIDVDGMKAVNDTYGHQAGDEVLVAVAATLTREGALVGRYGGDEFLVALPAADRRTAEAYRADVLAAVAATRVHDPHTGSAIPVLASVGLAIYPDESETIDEAIRLADHAMYAAKREHRDAPGAPASRTALADERAAKMIGEIVPLLTSPGSPEEKLRLVAHRLSVGAGYDVVRITTVPAADAVGSRAISTLARRAHGVVDARDDGPEHGEDAAVIEVLRRTKRPILMRDIDDVGPYSPAQRDMLFVAGIRSALSVPMISQDEMMGVLSVGTTSERGLDARDVQFLANVATQVTAILRTEALVEELRDAAARLQGARSDTVMLLAASAEAHDQTTGRHLQRVRTITEALSRELGYDEEQVQATGLGAVLHDIGKIRVPESILLSPAQLGDDDWALMKQHTTWGSEFLAGRPGFELAALIAGAHHERWDGSGYPHGLRGEAIPEVATIVSVADSLDAMTNDRPYRIGRALDWAIREITRCSGQQFNPRVVDALVRLHARNAVPLPGDERLDSYDEAA